MSHTFQIFTVKLQSGYNVFTFLTLFQAGMGQFDYGTIHLSVVPTEVGLGSPKLVTLFLSQFDLS